jgi:hypothetical protein
MASGALRTCVRASSKSSRSRAFPASDAACFAISRAPGLPEIPVASQSSATSKLLIGWSRLKVKENSRKMRADFIGIFHPSMRGRAIGGQVAGDEHEKASGGEKKAGGRKA